VLDLSRHLARPLPANYPESPDSCPRLELGFLVAQRFPASGGRLRAAPLAL